MSGKETHTMEDYLRVRKRNIILMSIMGILCVISAYLSLAINDNHMDVGDITTTIINHITGKPFENVREELEDLLVFSNFIPRAIGCVTIGAILAMGGAIMQSIIKNPLADPFTTGLSSGALVGVSITIIFGFSLGLSYQFDLMAMAFIFSMLPCGIIIFFTFFKKATSNIIILIGIAISYIFSAASTLILFMGTTMSYEKIYRWSLGSLASIDHDSWMVLIPSAILMLVIMIFMAKLVNIASVNDNFATSLGVNSPKTRMICLFIVSVFTAITVSYAGTIGFVGLIIPNIARRIVSSDTKILLPFSAILGGMFLLFSDCVARSIRLGGISVGIVTSLIGGPVMLLILLKMKKNSW